MDKEIVIDGKTLKLTNLDKVFWPKQKITKGDLLDYYSEIAPVLLPFISDRPQSLNRFPNGMEGPSFYQKNVEVHPTWVRTEKIWSEGNEDYINYLICNDKATLLYLINLGCIDLNIWNSRFDTLDNPDFLVLDLDPEEISFSAVIETAKEIHRFFEELGLDTFVKTSGASGLHIFLPLVSKYSYDQVKELARMIAIIINKKLPDITSIERMPAKRQGKVYIDFLQNRKGSTMASVFSVRPKKEANISMPVSWSEVREGLCPENFPFPQSLAEVKKRLKYFSPMLGDGYRLEDILELIQKIN